MRQKQFTGGQSSEIITWAIVASYGGLLSKIARRDSVYYLCARVTGTYQPMNFLVQTVNSLRHISGLSTWLPILVTFTQAYLSSQSSSHHHFFFHIDTADRPKLYFGRTQLFAYGINGRSPRQTVSIDHYIFWLYILTSMQ